MLSSFPQTAGDPDVLLRVYIEDTAHIPDNIVALTAVRFRQGRIPKQSKQYAPTPAQFIEEAEQEHRLETLRNRPRVEPPAIVRRGDFFKRIDAKRALYSNFPVLFENIGHDDYQKMMARKSLPNPHFWVAHTGVIYSGLHPKLAGKPVSKPHSEVA
jgi:hypothetical protein